jgi:FKBP-type peptidyl-prolyl cis-trans isomerase
MQNNYVPINFKNKNMRKFSYLILLLAVSFTSCEESFKKGEEGIEYKIIADGKGEKIKNGEYMQIHFAQYYNNGKTDSLLSDSRDNLSAIDMFDSASVPKNFYNILGQMRKGDSAVMRLLTDTILKQNPGRTPPFMKPGHMMLTTIKMVNIFKTKEEADSARQADMQVAERNRVAKEAASIAKDDKTLNDYFSKNNIKTVKGAAGTYVEILQPGTGPNIDTSVVVQTNYTGKLLDGKTFDSNTDSAFKHVEPLYVNMTSDPSLGVNVITGWKDGLKMLNKGAKARFYIPSGLGYGSQGNGADVPPYSILVFDIEVADVLNKEQGRTIAAEQRKKMEMMQQIQMQMQQQMQQQMEQQQAPQPK